MNFIVKTESYSQEIIMFPDGSKTFHGSEVTLFKAIADHLHFDYIIREPQTPGWGSISSGMAGEMTMGLSDVAWSQMYFSIWKWQFHDVTTSYDDSQACLMVNINALLKTPTFRITLAITAPKAWVYVSCCCFVFPIYT